jgi:predicted acyltransferase (DUF342 family)
MIPWQFLAFTAIMGGLLYLHFYFAHSRWRRVRGANPSDIDVNYVRREDYFAQSFRCKAKGWLELPSSNGNGTGERIITKGREHIRVSGPRQLGDREQSADILVIEGGFACGAACQLLSEIYAYGEAEIGTGSRLQAIAADQDLTLGDNVTVARWADSGGELTMGRACVVRSRVTARKAVRLAVGAEALSFFAPEITSKSEPGPASVAADPVSEQILQIPPPEGHEDTAAWKKLGFDRERLSQLNSDCWIYQGSLRPLAPLRVSAQLIVKGDCVCPPGSVLEKDLKVADSLAVAEGSECRGNLVAGKWISVGPRVQLAGLLQAGGEILLSRGVRGAAQGALVAAHAGSSLYLEGDVTWCGKLSAGDWVRVVPHAFAQNWRLKHQIQRESARA